MASFTQTLSETVGGTEQAVDSVDFSLALSEAIGTSDDTNNFTSLPENAQIEWPEGNPLFEVNWRTVSEALGGNGIIGKNDLKATANGSNALQVDIGAGSVYYEGNKYTLPSDTNVTLNTGDGTDDRWDTIVFDVTTGSISVKEGTPSPTPEPPDIEGGEIFIAVVYMPTGATDVTDSEILNWRAHALQGSAIQFNDPNYTAETLQEALSEAVEKFLDAAGDSLTGTLDLSDAGLPFSVGTNEGAYGSLIDMTVDANSTNGSEQSYSLSIDGAEFLKLRAESDGSGSIKNLSLEILQDVSFNLNQAIEFVLEHNAGTPAPGNKGRLVFDTNEGFVKVDNGNEVRRLTGRINENEFSADESGTVTLGNSGVMFAKGIENGETISIRQAVLLIETGEPAPTGLDLILATLDNVGNATKVGTIITGDGTVKHDEVGDPLASYTNTSGATQTIAILVDNGNFNSGSSADRDIIATARGEVR